MSGSLKIGGSELINDNGGSGSLQWGTGVPTDSLLQVKTSNKNTTQYLTPTSALNWQDVSDLSVNITPQTGNKVLVLTSLMVSAKQDYNLIVRVVRGTTGIQVGTGDGNKPASTYGIRTHGDSSIENLAGQFLDESPGGDGSTAITYKVQMSGEYTYNMWINCTYSENDLYHVGRFHSSITVMEIKG